MVICINFPYTTEGLIVVTWGRWVNQIIIYANKLIGEYIEFWNKSLSFPWLELDSRILKFCANNEIELATKISNMEIFLDFFFFGEMTEGVHLNLGVVKLI